jgi:hypothetical protein
MAICVREGLAGFDILFGNADIAFLAVNDAHKTALARPAYDFLFNDYLCPD